ncbi:hypothetical protein WA1_09330 [Scytonema hofmannii PCC 7110]|uniref:Uncharacterized protein n=1 Tax=Scytonema hofmannii PCC 7110 TaxID=128403 RepID=A0A139WSF8_9CYAN|nr:hypothetical protein [Scytonema hofmannii]KYC35337.1 hypothetical protein WA1_09330 [Scytonema hofmannii PCC 7110]
MKTIKKRHLFAEITTEESATASGGLKVITVDFKNNSFTVEDRKDEFNFNSGHYFYGSDFYDNGLPFSDFMGLRVEVNW